MITCCRKKIENNNKERILTFNEVLKGDPTRTISIRRRFISEINKRFGKLKRAITDVIVEGKILEDRKPMVFNRVTLNFEYTRSRDKVSLFMNWLKEREREFILSKGEGGIERVTIGSGGRLGLEPEWTDVYMRSAYQRGIVRARAELIKAGANIPSLEQSGGIMAAFNQPFHIDRVGAIYTRTFNELKGITATMEQQISRVLADGMASGLNPKQIAGDIRDIIGKKALNRARTLARTEVIRAHHSATIQEYKAMRIEGVRVKAEWSTSGFDVCPLCEPNEGKIFNIEDIQGMIPFHANCLLDSQVQVYTSEGWRKIGDIKVGDLVLTHKGRFRRVIKLHHTKKQTPNAVRIEWGNGQRNKLSLTNNHPVLIGNEWKEAKDIKKEDEIYYLADKCRRCGNYEVYYKDYCSRTCLSKDITDRQWSDPEHRKDMSEKASKQMLREYKLGIRDKDKITRKANEKCRELVKQGKWILQNEEVRESGRHLTNTKEHREKSSKRMKENNPMYEQKVKRKMINSLNELYQKHPEKRLNARMAKHRKSGRKTWIEERMSLLLDKLGIDYVFQYPILRYDVDFAIPALKIVIECDGEYWHKDKVADKIRQKRIEKEGWFVLRYTGKKINECLDEIQDELLRMTGNHRGEFKFVARKIIRVNKWKVKRPRTLYNLSVEEDESYIANGFVVHNCRCVALPITEEQIEKEEG